MEMVVLFVCFVGVALFNWWIGRFVRRHPDRIAGYNTMSRERKKYVDIEAQARILQRALTIAGLGSLLIYSLMWGLGVRIDVTFGIAMTFSGLVIVFGAIYAEKFDSKSKIGKIWRK